MVWTDNEEGPMCSCGYRTVVKLSDGQPLLICLFHTYEEGACWFLPMYHKPEGWPDIPNEDIAKLIEEGEQEQKRLQALQELTEETERLGLYDDGKKDG